MGSKVIVGPFGRGFRNDVPPFYVDNDSFPKLVNAYQWRARVKRKRGTSPICRLQRFFNSASTAYSAISTFNLVGGAGNLLIGFNLEANGNINPGTVQFTVAGNVYTDPAEDGVLVGAPTGSGTINYATGAITIVGGAGSAVTLAIFNYFPDLPAMGLPPLLLLPQQFPQTMAFDTRYSYQIVTSSPYYSYDVSFYKNPIADPINLPGYIPKTILTLVRWNGMNYQQFWSVNYENALWTTNGIQQPFSNTNIGMQFKRVTNVSNIVPGPPATVQLTIAAHGLVVGDFVFLNEFPSATITGINLQSGYVIAIVDVNNVSVELPFATLGGAGGAVETGIAQYLTNTAIPGKDVLRWYDGDPTSGSEFSPTLTGNKGWVNFMPPISQLSPQINPDNLPPAQYYLVGARMIIPYKDRLLFLGAVIQSSTTGPFYLQDTIIFSQNGTPYYNTSYTNVPNAAIDTPASANTIFHAILAPTNQSATSPAYFNDIAGFGGYISAGYAQPITTVGYNQDVLLVGFTTRQTKIIYTNNDLLPFNFYIINSELGSTATFSSIVLDRGVITIGDRGIALTDQQSSSRIDSEISDQIFEFDLLNNGTQRITSQRDFVSEWIYFSYPSSAQSGKTSPFPNRTIFYNYRDQSWAIFDESYTCYGPFRRQSGFTWQTVGSFFPSWNSWNEPWNASSSSLLEPEVIAGNQQGFIVCRESATTSETSSLYIQAISISGTVVTITSPSHGLNTGDFVYFLGALGMTDVNSVSPAYIIWQVTVLAVDTFEAITNRVVAPSGTYLGNGTITRLYKPQIQSKQFPVAWEIGRKTRIGTQRYLFTKTNNAQIELQIFLSQDAGNAYNAGNIVPGSNSKNNSLIYSDVLYTCLESVNLGLTTVTAANTNLQMIGLIDNTGTNATSPQAQIWHRMNTSLIGDTVQVGFTINDEQMFDPTLTNQIAEIEMHGMIIDVSPSSMLS